LVTRGYIPRLILSPTAASLAIQTPSSNHAITRSIPILSIRNSAKLQYAYDEALITEGFYAAQTRMRRFDADFHGKTQAITVAYNGEHINFYSHHALQIIAKVGAAARNRDSAETATRVKHHQYRPASDLPRGSPEDFGKAYSI
jgi:hypothetical protein